MMVKCERMLIRKIFSRKASEVSRMVCACAIPALLIHTVGGVRERILERTSWMSSVLVRSTL